MRATVLGGVGLVGATAFPWTAWGGGLSGNSDAALNDAPLSESRVLLGTFVTVSIAQCGNQQAQEGLERAFAEIVRLESIFSRYDSASPLSLLNSQGRLNDAPPELRGLVERAGSFAQLSGKAFDPTVKPVVDLFKKRQNPQGLMRLDPADLNAARALVGFEHVRLTRDSIAFDRAHMGMTLDGIAKGRIVDSASALLLGLGLHHHLINAGGDIIAMGEKSPGKAWVVAVENPLYKNTQGTGYPAVLELRQGALASSGSYEIYYDASREHHHIVNPASGRSPTAVSSVSVLAPTATEADALATALSVMPPHEAIAFVNALPARECCILGQNKLRLESRGWRG